jgi:hypothetical protein
MKEIGSRMEKKGLCRGVRLGGSHDFFEKIIMICDGIGFAV